MKKEYGTPDLCHRVLASNGNLSNQTHEALKTKKLTSRNERGSYGKKTGWSERIQHLTSSSE